MKTVVGLYNSVDQANQVKTALASQGLNHSDVTVIDQSSDYSQSGTGLSQSGSGYSQSASGSGFSREGSDYDTTGSNEDSVGGKIKHFFSSLTGHDDESHRSYAEGVGSGGALLAVTVPDERAEEAADFLESHGARDIQGGYGNSSYGSTGSGSASYGDPTFSTTGDSNYGTGTGTLGASSGIGARDTGTLQGNTGTTGNYGTGSVAGEQVIPVVEEELQVGKRAVQRGGVRIYSRVVEEPVSESVNLHDERVVVDRRPVDRPATEADFTTGSGVVEVTATGEEAVVGKRSRVVEEILVGKEASDRTEEISDTVRRTEVNVEPATTGVGTGSTTGSTTGSSFGSTTGSKTTDFDR